MNINTTFKTSSGKNVSLTLNIENSKITGSAVVNGTSYSVTDIAVVQNRKCLKIQGASAPYMPISDSLYNEINAICKAQFAANMTPRDILEMKVAQAEAKYNKAMSESWNNVAIIEAREEWNRLSRELAKLS
jgi:1,6-anhydro-N-acetylmuramate kinase